MRGAKVEAGGFGARPNHQPEDRERVPAALLPAWRQAPDASAAPPRCHMAGRGPVDGEGTRHDGVARVGRFCASSLARRRAKRGAGKSDSFRSVGLGPRCLHSGRRAPAARRRHVRHNTVLCAHIGVRPPGPAVRIYAHSHPGTIYPGLMVAFRFSVALIFIRELYVFDRPSAGWSHFDPRDTRITIRVQVKKRCVATNIARRAVTALSFLIEHFILSFFVVLRVLAPPTAANLAFLVHDAHKAVRSPNR